MVAEYPNIASIIDIGESYENRPMRVLKLSNGPGKSGMFIESVIHAREWIGPPTVLYAINELTENLAENQAMLDAHDFYFMPVANPDGYAFSWTDVIIADIISICAHNTSYIVSYILRIVFGGKHAVLMPDPTASEPTPTGILTGIGEVKKQIKLLILRTTNI